MANKIVIIADPGIDGAFAIALALHDPSLEVLGLAATAGNVNCGTSDAECPRSRRAARPAALAAPWRGPVRSSTKLMACACTVPVAWAASISRSPSCIIRTPATSSSATWSTSIPGSHGHRPRAADCAGPRPRPRSRSCRPCVNRVIILGGAWHEPGNAGPVVRVPLLLRSPLLPAGAAQRHADDAYSARRVAQDPLLADGPSGTASGVARPVASCGRSCRTASGRPRTYTASRGFI